MSKSPNTVVVGAFVAGAFLILFSLLFMLSGNLFKRNVDVGLMIFDGSLKGRWILTGGMGGMGGAQPLAATLAGASILVVEVDPERIRRRLESSRHGA